MIHRDDPQYRELVAAFLASYPTREALAYMVYYGLSEHLSMIVAEEANHEYALHMLLQWACQQGKLRNLLEAALRFSSQNGQLRHAANLLGFNFNNPASSQHQSTRIWARFRFDMVVRSKFGSPKQRLIGLFLLLIISIITGIVAVFGSPHNPNCGVNVLVQNSTCSLPAPDRAVKPTPDLTVRPTPNPIAPPNVHARIILVPKTKSIDDHEMTVNVPLYTTSPQLHQMHTLANLPAVDKATSTIPLYVSKHNDVKTENTHTTGRQWGLCPFLWPFCPAVSSDDVTKLNKLISDGKEELTQELENEIIKDLQEKKAINLGQFNCVSKEISPEPKLGTQSDNVTAILQEECSVNYYDNSDYDQLIQKYEQDMRDDLQKNDENSTSVACKPEEPPSQTPPFTLTVSCFSTYYLNADLKQVINDRLHNEEPFYQLSGRVSIDHVSVLDTNGGTVTLHAYVSASEFYQISKTEQDDLVNHVTGMKRIDAEIYIKQQPGIDQVYIDITPNIDTLPDDIKDIQVTLANPVTTIP